MQSLNCKKFVIQYKNSIIHIINLRIIKKYCTFAISNGRQGTSKVKQLKITAL